MQPNLATSAALIGDPGRAAILWALVDGRAQPATALAYAANLSSQAASNHLAKLVDGGLLTVEAQGRHRYYRLASPQVAAAMEALASLAPPIRALEAPRSPSARALRLARSCYDHLAGRLGVAIADALENGGRLRAADVASKLYEVTAEGRRWFLMMGIDVARLPHSSRGLARRCLDWTERRHHLAGPLGVRLLSRMEELGWIKRQRETRSVCLTEAGVAGLREVLGIDCRELSDDLSELGSPATRTSCHDHASRLPNL